MRSETKFKYDASDPLMTFPFSLFLIQGPLGVDGKPVSTLICHHIDHHLTAESSTCKAFGSLLPIV